MTRRRSNQRLLVVLLSAVIVAVAISFSVGALRSAPSCILRLDVDPGAVRPRIFVIMNPLRDRGPERLANDYFRKLKAGRSAELRRTFVGNTEVMTEEEVRYPPTSWRIGDRVDEANLTRISYWVRRGSGYPGEEEASFEFSRVPSWKLVSYNAIY